MIQNLSAKKILSTDLLPREKNEGRARHRVERVLQCSFKEKEKMRKN